jgi:hypothetical protein
MREMMMMSDVGASGSGKETKACCRCSGRFHAWRTWREPSAVPVDRQRVETGNGGYSADTRCVPLCVDCAGLGSFDLLSKWPVGFVQFPIVSLKVFNESENIEKTRWAAERCPRQGPRARIRGVGRPPDVRISRDE